MGNSTPSDTRSWFSIRCCSFKSCFLNADSSREILFDSVVTIPMNDNGHMTLYQAYLLIFRVGLSASESGNGKQEAIAEPVLPPRDRPVLCKQINAATLDSIILSQPITCALV